MKPEQGDEFFASTLQDYIMIVDSITSRKTKRIEDMGSYNRERTVYPKFIFRGHSNARDYKLIPGIFRKVLRKSVGNEEIYTEIFDQDEQKVLYEFISESCSFLKEINTNDYAGWIEVAQHYAVPTRLLDFTYNALVALFFACLDEKTMDGEVWFLDEIAYKKKYYPDYDGSVNNSKKIVDKIIQDEIIHPFPGLHSEQLGYYQHPWIYKPMYRATRMSMQSSVFLLWAASQMDLEVLVKHNNRITLNQCDSIEGIMGRVIIPQCAKEKIKLQLDTCGINYKFIYSDLGGIGKYVRSKFENPINTRVAEYRINDN